VNSEILQVKIKEEGISLEVGGYSERFSEELFG